MIPARRLRVLYDASLASNPAGTGTYVRGLLSGLRSRPEIELITTTFESGSAGTLDTGQKEPLGRVVSSLRHLAYYLQALPRRARELECDLIYCPSSLVPLRGATPCLMTVYDLTPLRYSSTQDWLSRQYIAGMMRAGVRRASAICTISKAVGAELVERFPRVAPEHVSVAYPGPNPDLLAAQPTRATLPDRPFTLMVGTVEPRKNHITALRALAEHRRRRPGSELMLVAAGSAGWQYGPILRAIEELGLTDHVVRLGVVEPGTLKWLYQAARALLFPSLYEGFGLPVLEALYLECPVIAAEIPSVVEITGSAATLLPPTDVPAWAAALEAIAEGRPKERGANAAGLERARQFTWEACADAAVNAMQAVQRPQR
jgi:glycosyltransferase involved in cell wall biosynthesis